MTEDVESTKPLEEQFIIRFPPELAKRVRNMIRDENFEEVLSFSIPDGERIGQFIAGSEQYQVTLCDLPCVLETHKTEDSKVYYKSGDIGQILLVEDINPLNESKQYDSNFNIINGLTPATKNIRKRKFRKVPKIDIADIKEAQAEIIRLQKGGVMHEYDIELIPVNEVESIFEIPGGNTIVTRKNGKAPIRAGYPSTFTEAELDLLPDIHKTLAKEEELKKENEEIDDESVKSEDSDFVEEPSLKKAKYDNTNQPVVEDIQGFEKKMQENIQEEMAIMSQSQIPAPDASVIRALRCKKVDIANEINKLNNQTEASRMANNLESNPIMKARLTDRIEKFKEQINQKKQEMALVDAELAQYNLL